MALADLFDWIVRNILVPVGLGPDRVMGFIGKLPEAITILILAYGTARVISWTVHRFVLRPRRVDPMIGELITRLTIIILLFVGFALSLRIYGVDLFSFALAAGLIGAALALGLQNTVANIMGGISLAWDRPFEVGDRVLIGDTWGDILRIGLRSTTLITVRREVVVIPNRLMDEREIWNYTQSYPELRIDVQTNISYDSDTGRAMQIMLDIARAHSEVLDFPEPRARIEELGDHGVLLELRCFIGDARRRWWVQSDLLFDILQRFKNEEVEIPYPYRTLVEKRDLPAVPDEGTPKPRQDEPLGQRRILVASAGPGPATGKANTIIDLAADLEADVIVGYIADEHNLLALRDGERAAQILQRSARRKGVNVQLSVERGKDVVEAIQRLVRSERCGAVIIGASKPGSWTSWMRPDIEARLRKELSVPLIVIPPDLKLAESEIMGARAALDQMS